MPADRWLEREGLRLHLVEWPPQAPTRQPDIFMLHGLSANALYWSRLAASFPDRRLVALDQRSHGQSDRPAAGNGAYTTEKLVEDAAIAIGQLGLDRPVVLGHSWGAGIALDLAATHPELISGLGFIDGPAGPMSERLSWEEASRLMQPPLPRFLLRADAAEHVRPWLRDAWGEDLQAYAEASAMPDGDQWILTLTAEVRLEILREMFESQPQLNWAALTVPCLVAMAVSDPVIMAWKRQGVDLVQSLAPQSLVRWYDSAHDIPLIKPAQLAADVRNLCQRAAWHLLSEQVIAADGDWQGGIAGGDWSARDLLAHLASTISSLPQVVTSASAARAASGSPAEPFDADRWNASQVRRRRERSPQELRAEVADGTATLNAALGGADLSAPAQIGPYAGLPLGEVMEEMLDHQRNHLGQLLSALKAVP